MKNWKTTLVGCIIATLGILKTAIESYQTGTPINWMQVGICIAVAVFGLVMKDFDVTGAGPTAMTAKQVSKVVSVSLFALLLGAVACAYIKTSVLTADSSDGKHWPLCVRWSEDAVGKVSALACGDASMTMDQLKAQVLRDHPRAIVHEVTK